MLRKVSNNKKYEESEPEVQFAKRALSKNRGAVYFFINFFSCPEQLYKSSCQSVGWSVGRSVGPPLRTKVTLLLSTSYFLLTTYLLFISDSSDSSDSKDSSDRFVMKQLCD